jgi:hypothetical protein
MQHCNILAESLRRATNVMACFHGTADSKFVLQDKSPVHFINFDQMTNVNVPSQAPLHLLPTSALLWLAKSNVSVCLRFFFPSPECWCVLDIPHLLLFNTPLIMLFLISGTLRTCSSTCSQPNRPLSVCLFPNLYLHKEKQCKCPQYVCCLSMSQLAACSLSLPTAL